MLETKKLLFKVIVIYSTILLLTFSKTPSSTNTEKQEIDDFNYIEEHEDYNELGMEEVIQLEKLKKQKCDPADPERIQLVKEYVKKNKNSLSQEDIDLINFIAGDCLPAVLLPGLYSNKLQLHIQNCTALNYYHPETAKSCGYDKKCKDNTESIFWLSEKFITHDNRTCLAHLIKLNLKKNDTATEIEEKYYEVPFNGFKLTYYGNTPETEKDNECGFGASTFLLDRKLYFGTKAPRGFEDIKNHFLSLGYKVGINLFSVPLDWRRHSNDQFNVKLIKETVDLAYKLTGKKSVLLGHSFGGICALNYLYSLKEEEKEQKISRFIGLSPPFLGANRVIKSFIMGTNDLNNEVKIVMDILSIYYSLENQKILFDQLTSTYEMNLKYFWDIYKDADWMNIIRKRAEVENKITNCVKNFFAEKLNSMDHLTFLENLEDNKKLEKKTKIATKEEDQIILQSCILGIKSQYLNELQEFKEKFIIFPDLEEGCAEQTINSATCGNEQGCKVSIWDKYCRMNFFIPFDTNVTKIKDGENTIEYDLLTEKNLKDMIMKYGIGNPDVDFIDYGLKLINRKLHELKHPKVPVVIYYASNTKTEVSYDIPGNPKAITDSGDMVIDIFGKDIMKLGGGDGTVPSACTLLPPLTWSLDKESENHPVHLAEYCSNSKFSPKEINFDSNQYLNIGCRCKSPSGEACSHSSMVGDDHILSHATNYFINEKFRESISKTIEDIDLVNKGINNVKDHNCSNLKSFNEKFYSNHIE